MKPTTNGGSQSANRAPRIHSQRAARKEYHHIIANGEIVASGDLFDTNRYWVRLHRVGEYPKFMGSVNHHRSNIWIVTDGDDFHMRCSTLQVACHALYRHYIGVKWDDESGT